MPYRAFALAALAAAALALPAAAEDLKPLASFDAITDEAARSVALFTEAGKVIEHPRCLNCHPVGNGPTQGMDMHPHQPPVVRGEADMGAAGMMCTTCHGAANVKLVAQAENVLSIPGNPTWMLAPASLAWAGKPLGEICAQIKDPELNSGKTLDEVAEDMATNELVGWAWDPGEGREPVPGTQAEFAALIKAWVESGAQCPG